jgi:hypothetical protein
VAGWLADPSLLVREASSMRYVYIIAQTAASTRIIVQAYLRQQQQQHVRIIAQAIVVVYGI